MISNLQKTLVFLIQLTILVLVLYFLASSGSDSVNDPAQNDIEYMELKYYRKQENNREKVEQTTTEASEDYDHLDDIIDEVLMVSTTRQYTGETKTLLSSTTELADYEHLDNVSASSLNEELEQGLRVLDEMQESNDSEWKAAQDQAKMPAKFEKFLKARMSLRENLDKLQELAKEYHNQAIQESIEQIEQEANELNPDDEPELERMIEDLEEQNLEQHELSEDELEDLVEDLEDDLEQHLKPDQDQSHKDHEHFKKDQDQIHKDHEHWKKDQDKNLNEHLKNDKDQNDNDHDHLKNVQVKNHNEREHLKTVEVKNHNEREHWKNDPYKNPNEHLKYDQDNSNPNLQHSKDHDHSRHKRTDLKFTEPEEVKYDEVCSLQLIETVPLALRQGNHAKTMPVEHMSIYHVSPLNNES